MTDDQLLEANVSTNIQVMESLGLTALNDPFFNGRTATFETIK